MVNLDNKKKDAILDTLTIVVSSMTSSDRADGDGVLGIIVLLSVILFQN